MISNESKSKIEKMACSLILIIIMLFFAMTVIRFFTRQILIKHFGISNSFTDIVFFDVQNLNSNENTSEDIIDWAKLYPFSDSATPQTSDNVSAAKVVKAFSSPNITNYTGTVSSLKSKIDTYVTDYLIGYRSIVACAYKYKDVIKWNYVSYGEYNGVTKLSDGTLTTCDRKRDVDTRIVSSVTDFTNYCNDNGIILSYFQVPGKISVDTDPDICGVIDYTSQNSADLINALRANGTDVFSYYEAIESDGLNTHQMFYKTDHHWRGETGLWAARHLVTHINEQYGYDLDVSLLDETNFEKREYPEWFLGSQGKKVTLSVTDPDDFTLLYPKFDTSLSFCVPDIKVNVTGDFSVTYNMDQVNECDYYLKNPYAAYMYGTHPLATFDNHLSDSDLKILVIHDSQANCVIPFISLVTKYVDSIDPREFDGSIKTYIETTEPDVIILMYCTTSYSLLFDYR